MPAGASSARAAHRARWRTPRRRRPCGRGTPASGWCRSPRTAGSRSAPRPCQSATAGSSSISTAMCSSASSPIATLVGQHDGERLADVAHLVVGDHRLLERLELRQRLQPHRDDRHPARHVLGGDDRVHAGTLAAPPRRRSRRCGRAPPSCAGSPHRAGPRARDRRHIGRGRAGSADPRAARSACR